MKKKSQFWPITCSIILVIIGIFLLAFPDIGDFVDSTNNILYVVMYIYAGIKLIQYCFCKAPDDYEDLFMCMASVIAGTSGIIFNLEDTTKVLSLTLFGWLVLVSIIKLIKIDYLIQHKNSMFNVKIVLFSAFVLAGLLSSVNIFYAISNQTIMLGFFFLINGLLELAYPLIENYHLTHLKDISEKNLLEKESSIEIFNSKSTTLKNNKKQINKKTDNKLLKEKKALTSLKEEKKIIKEETDKKVKKTKKVDSKTPKEKKALTSLKEEEKKIIKEETDKKVIKPKKVDSKTPKEIKTIKPLKDSKKVKKAVLNNSKKKTNNKIIKKK